MPCASAMVLTKALHILGLLTIPIQMEIQFKTHENLCEYVNHKRLQVEAISKFTEFQDLSACLFIYIFLCWNS